MLRDLFAVGEKRIKILIGKGIISDMRLLLADRFKGTLFFGIGMMVKWSLFSMMASFGGGYWWLLVGSGWLMVDGGW
jgi:hypothetical protein